MGAAQGHTAGAWLRREGAQGSHCPDQSFIIIPRRGIFQFPAFFLQELLPPYLVAGRDLGPRGTQ